VIVVVVVVAVAATVVVVVVPTVVSSTDGVCSRKMKLFRILVRYENVCEIIGRKPLYFNCHN
jgi:hypothetical protein